MTPELLPDEIEWATEEGLAIIGEAEALQVTDAPSFEAAAAMLRRLKNEILTRRAHYKPLKQAADQAKAALLDQERAHLAGRLRAEEILKAAMSAYETAQRRERMLAEARAAQEAKETGAMVPAVPVAVPQATGVTFSSRWKGVVTDPRAFMDWCVKTGHPETYLEVKQSVLDDLARAQRGAMGIPGVEAREERVVGAKA
jgi:hypothetical protein